MSETQPHAACKKHTLKEQITLKAKRLERYAITSLDFRAKIITREKGDHFIIIKESVHWEDVTILNIYASNSLKVHNTKTERSARRNLLYSQRFPYLSLNKRENK